MSKKRVLLGISAFMFAGILAVAGCTPQAQQAPSENQAEQNSASTEVNLGPEVRTLDDGTLVQLVPTGDKNFDMYKANERGCYSCHEDLHKTVNNISYTVNGRDFVHLENGGLDGYRPSVTQCTGCHVAFGDFQGAIHAIHGVGTAPGEVVNGLESPACFDCHDVVGDELVLWDEVKYGKFNGITTVENVTGEFAFDQDYTVEADNMPNARWQTYDWDHLRHDNTVNNVPLDQEMFDTWEISLTGLVEEEVTFKLVDLIANAPVEKAVLATQCTTNVIGGNQIAQVEITGIPLSYLLDQVKIKEEAVSFTWHTPDGVIAGWRGQNLNDLPEDSYIVYEINGEPLSWYNGYPCILWMGGMGADRLSKNVSELRFGTNDYTMHLASEGYGSNNTFSGEFFGAKPNIGLMNTPEGKIIKAGEPYTFEGWAHGWDQAIAGVEFSMDGGVTWERFDTPNTTNRKWVHWTYTWTPSAEAGDTAYLLQMRSIAEDGRVTPAAYQVMVNAKVEMPMVSEAN